MNDHSPATKIRLSFVSEVNKQELHFWKEHRQQQQMNRKKRTMEFCSAISCRVMINSHLIALCAQIVSSCLYWVVCQRARRRARRESWERKENLLLERFRMNMNEKKKKKQQTRKKASVGLPMYHNRISFCWFPFVFFSLILISVYLVASHAWIYCIAYNFIWRTRLSEANQRYKTDD